MLYKPPSPCFFWKFWDHEMFSRYRELGPVQNTKMKERKNQWTSLSDWVGSSPPKKERKKEKWQKQKEFLVTDKTWTKTKHKPTRHGPNGVFPWNGRTPHFLKNWLKNGRGAVAAVATTLPSLTVGNSRLGSKLEYCVQGPCASTAPESQGWKSGSHSRDSTTTILQSRFSKWGVPCDEFLAWYAQREGLSLHWSIQVDVFHSGRMAKFLSGQSEHEVGLTFVKTSALWPRTRMEEW